MKYPNVRNIQHVCTQRCSSQATLLLKEHCIAMVKYVWWFQFQYDTPNGRGESAVEYIAIDIQKLC